jgi:hypothetical protein
MVASVATTGLPSIGRRRNEPCAAEERNKSILDAEVRLLDVS